MAPFLRAKSIGPQTKKKKKELKGRDNLGLAFILKMSN
jgi:hypothetical protein